MSILNLINKNANLRKIFGKRELVIIQKQLLGVQLKNSEKTRLSRDIKKKLEAIKEIAKFSSEFELKKGAEIKKRVEEAKEIILQNKNIIDSNLTKKLKDMKGMRNIIAHQYGDVNDEFMYTAINKEIEDDVKTFLEIIKKLNKK